jgi:hypothetical protein
MPSSPVLAQSGLGVIGAISLIALAASFLTLIASAVLVWRYRRTVARLMSARAGEAGHQIAGLSQTGRDASPLPQDSALGAAPRVFPPGGDRSVERLFHRVISEPRCQAYKYALGGASFALIVGLAGFVAFSQTQFNPLRAAAHPLQLVFLFWTFAWPIVLTTNVVAVTSRRNRWLNVLAYFVVLAGLGGPLALTPTEPSFQFGNVSLPAWSGESPLRLAGKWIAFNLAPTLLIVVFRYRRMRAVTPLVLSFMTVVSAGVLGMIAAAFLYQDLSVRAIDAASEALNMSASKALIGYFLVLCALACVLFAALGWLLLDWLRGRYQRKSVSDQSLAIDSLWLLFAAFYAVMLANAGPGWALSVLLAFVVFKLAVHLVENRLASKRDGRELEPALLVLRVFALGNRSEILFEAVTKHWRHVGNVNLIAGTDLALSTVAPHQFLAFVSGSLDRLFIRNEAAVERSLAGRDRRRDADGRFRINDFFCHADTWRALLSGLIKSTDVVLMDLRSLAPGNAGCIFEIKALLNAMPLEQVVFVVDDTTDRALLDQTWQDALRELRSDSPNKGSRSPSLQSFELGALGYRELHALLRRLCDAAAGRLGTAPG